MTTADHAQSSCRLACRLEVLPGDRVIDQIGAAQRYGFDGIGLPGRFIDQWIEPLRECHADSPLPFVGLSLGYTGSLLDSRPAERRKCYDSLLRLFDICAEFGIGLFNMPPHLIQDNPQHLIPSTEPASTVEQLDTLLLEQLPELGGQAKQRGVKLLIEPVNRFESEYLHSIIHAARLCQSVNHPAIGITADFFHMQLEELKIDDAIRIAFPWLRHVHVAENTRVEPGPGSLDFGPGFKELQQGGYDGWIEVECRSLSGNPDEVLPASVRYLRRCWQTADAGSSS